MNFKLLLALLPFAISASRFQTAASSDEMISVESTEASKSVAESEVVVEQQEEPETEAQAWFKRVMAYEEDPQEVAERRRLAAEEMAPSRRVVEAMQRIKQVNSTYGQRVVELHPLEKLRLLEAMQEPEDNGSPYSNFELTYGIAGEMLPVYMRYMQSQERK